MSSDTNAGAVRRPAAAPADAGTENPLVDRLDEPAVFAPPEGWTTTTPWRRAQAERDLGGPAATPGYRRVLLEESTSAHRVLFAISDGELRAECDCRAFTYRQWCSHIAALWWQWSRARIVVPDLDAGRQHLHPPAWLKRRGGEA